MDEHEDVDVDEDVDVAVNMASAVAYWKNTDTTQIPYSAVVT